jgi:ATP-binding cassette subfamily B protein
VRRPDILILDEASANLDAISQNAVLENILGARREQGIIWILNRVSDAQHFSKIVVLKSGRVVESGSFDELSTAQGEFQTLLDAG